MAKFSVNTHHAYLNNEIVIKSDETACIVDTITGEPYKVLGELSVHLSAGEHCLESDDHEEHIFIEDAIKFGGSRIKNAFVFDNNPWIFITTKDRLYLFNRDTKEENVEYKVTPDEIICVKEDIPSKYFIFRTNEDYSIYNVETGKIIFNFSNYIYSNGHLVIYKKEEAIIVFNYIEQEILTDFSSQYSIGNKFYYVKGRTLYGLNLNNDEIKRVNVGEIYNEMYILTSDYLVKLLGGNDEYKKYRIYTLGDGETIIEMKDCILPFYIKKWKDIECYRYKELEKHYSSFYASNRSLFESNSIKKPKLIGIEIDEYNKREDNMFTIVGRICMTLPKGRFNKVSDISFVIETKGYNNLHFNDANYLGNVICKDNDKVKTPPHENNLIKLNDNETLISKSESDNLIITQNGTSLFLRKIKESSIEEILSNIFDSSVYTNAYFTSDGKSVILQINDKEARLLGFDNHKTNPFEVEGFTVARNEGYNGYKPEITIQDGRIPVWRDPITLHTVSEKDMSNHIFMSPDGKFTADIKEKTILFNRLTKKESTENERIELRKKYNWNSETSKEDKNTIIQSRKALAERTNRLDLFGKIIEMYKDNEKLINDEIKAYLEEKDNFVELIIDRLGYVCFKENKTNAQTKNILIGRSVYYLNYVSFSYDSKYLSFSAKMKRDSFRFSEDGIIVIYDIENDRIIKRMESYNQCQLYAVWMTMFSKNGDVAFYDSKADAYFVSKKSNFKDVTIIPGKSLLCFSPSGKYIAFSDQNYIDYTHHPNGNWGHQPSGNVFIHSTDDLDVCMEQYNDFGEGIGGVASKAGCVASAAFSQDEKRLLVVGNDGVVVIRNLYLSKTNEDNNLNIFEDNDDYGTHYGEFAGSYAQDVMGYSDDVINDAFEGDPDNYWNID